MFPPTFHHFIIRHPTLSTEPIAPPAELCAPSVGTDVAVHSTGALAKKIKAALFPPADPPHPHGMETDKRRTAQTRPLHHCPSPPTQIMDDDGDCMLAVCPTVGFHSWRWHWSVTQDFYTRTLKTSRYIYFFQTKVPLEWCMEVFNQKMRMKIIFFLSFDL